MVYRENAKHAKVRNRIVRKSIGSKVLMCIEREENAEKGGAGGYKKMLGI